MRICNVASALVKKQGDFGFRVERADIPDIVRKDATSMSAILNSFGTMRLNSCAAESTHPSQGPSTHLSVADGFALHFHLQSFFASRTSFERHLQIIALDRGPCIPAELPATKAAS